MKKAFSFLKSNILLFIGALLFLLFLNYLVVGGATLAIGIIGVLTAAYYITIGLLGIFIGDKLNALTRKIFEIVAVCLFAFLMFMSSTVSVISMIQRSTDPQFPQTFGPTGWFVEIFALLSSLALLGFYPFARLFKAPTLKKLAYLFAALFALGLLLNMLFDIQGFAINLGNIPFVYLALDLLFLFYLFETLGDTKEEPKAIPQKAPAKEEKKEEKAEEPAPIEEAPAEEPAQEE